MQGNPASVFVIAVLLILVVVALRSVRIANEWQRGVVLRLGRFSRLGGPGLYLVLPGIDQVTMVIDNRVQTTSITAEQALTRDTVAVGVDAIVFWRVTDAKAAAINIANYREAIERVAQTSLREMIGSTDLQRLLSDRQTADENLRASITEKTSSWGVAATSVEIRDVAIPKELQDAMSRQAQAEREKAARVTLASAEQEIARQVLEAAKIYNDNPTAMRLRQMNLLVRDEQGPRHDRADPDRDGIEPRRGDRARPGGATRAGLTRCRSGPTSSSTAAG